MKRYNFVMVMSFRIGGDEFKSIVESAIEEKMHDLKKRLQEEIGIYDADLC